jgi:hypothetical protein
MQPIGGQATKIPALALKNLALCLSVGLQVGCKLRHSAATTALALQESHTRTNFKPRPHCTRSGRPTIDDRGRGTKRVRGFLVFRIGSKDWPS